MNSRKLLQRTESLRAADRPAGLLTRLSRAVTRNDTIARALRGAWLGHPVHPILVTAPIGAWLSTAVLDASGHPAAARRVIAFGLANVPAAVLAGLADYADLEAPQRRVAVAHAVANAVATSLVATSFGYRCAGRHGVGALLNLAGLAATGAGGALGGHLAYAMGAGVRRFNPPFVRRPEPVAAG